MKKLITISLVILGLVVVMLYASYSSTSQVGSHELNSFPGWRTKTVQSGGDCNVYYKGYVFVYEKLTPDCQKHQNLPLFAIDVVVLSALLVLIAVIISAVTKRPSPKVLHQQVDLVTVKIVGYIGAITWYLVIYNSLSEISMVSMYLLLFALILTALEYGLYRHWNNKNMHPLLTKALKSIGIFFAITVGSSILLYLGILVYSITHHEIEKLQSSYSVTALYLLFVIVVCYVLISFAKDIYRYLKHKAKK